jgi:hypothetical protein
VVLPEPALQACVGAIDSARVMSSGSMEGWVIRKETSWLKFVVVMA